MHIVHLTASALFGGPERQMLGLASALPSPYSSTFLSFAEGGRCQPFLAAARASGFDAAELRHDTPNLPAAVRELTAFLRFNMADVLITHGYKSNLLGRLAARQAGLPIVSVSRGWTGENFRVACYEAVDRVHLRLMDCVVCVSGNQANRVRQAGVTSQKIRVIRNAARLRAFRDVDPSGQQRLRAIAGGSGSIVVAAGRLSPEKGFHVLVEAAHDVCRHMADVRFVLFGEGPERARLESRIAALGLSDRFQLPGFRDDLDRLLPWADVVALSSFTEGMPNIALEAGAAGVPVVATDVGGTSEVVVDGETGFLVRSGSMNELSTRLLNLLSDRALAAGLGRAARQWVTEQFSFEAQARAYQALFAELPATRGRIGGLQEAACS
jgi:glycosyltransferase involved in cell wall biosynthesis